MNYALAQLAIFRYIIDLNKSNVNKNRLFFNLKILIVASNSSKKGFKVKKEIANRLQTTIADTCNGNKTAFAKLLGIPYGTLKNYLDLNKTNIIASETLAKLHKKLGININWLLTGKGEMYLNEQEQNQEFDIENILQHLTPQQKQELLNRSQEMRLMNTLKERVENVEEALFSNKK
ncbi:helix-turn-helix domain-containing protein [Candidatus Albibeggiatoa sp. nov. BB20]|uniref:helix-turn-helix domain-containing protein n=1 Tax=Candidatus Albibeggiatoa sp. nov. BB20 TaxID=3162723 RepID=UPI0033654A8A